MDQMTGNGAEVNPRPEGIYVMTLFVENLRSYLGDREIVDD